MLKVYFIKIYLLCLLRCIEYLTINYVVKQIHNNTFYGMTRMYNRFKVNTVLAIYICNSHSSEKKRTRKYWSQHPKRIKRIY